jgi:uncharacterized protein YkwD
MRRPKMSIARTLAISSLLAATLIPLQSSPSFAQVDCPNADVRPPIGLNPQDRAVRLNVATAVACLVRAEHRKATGMRLRGDNRLAQAAFKHAEAAEQLKWWGAGSNPHVNPQTGSTVISRIRAEGYCSPRAIAQTAEIAYTGAGPGSTARAAVNWWMNSPSHRAIITNPNLRDFGLGMVPGLADRNIPSSSNMATYVVAFGRCA